MILKSDNVRNLWFLIRDVLYIVFLSFSHLLTFENYYYIWGAHMRDSHPLPVHIFSIRDVLYIFFLSFSYSPTFDYCKLPHFFGIIIFFPRSNESIEVSQLLPRKVFQTRSRFPIHALTNTTTSQFHYTLHHKFRFFRQLLSSPRLYRFTLTRLI